MKKLYIILAIVAGMSANLSAQSLRGGIKASDIKATKTGETMLVEMTVDIDGDAVTKLQSISVTPILTSGTEEVKFPYILVNGGNKQDMYKRKDRFKNTFLVNNRPMKVVEIDRKNRGEKIAYTAEMDYAPWMDNATMSIEFFLSSPAGVLQRYVAEVARREVVKEVVVREVVREIPAPPAVVPAPVAIPAPVPEPVAVPAPAPEPVVVPAPIFAPVFVPAPSTQVVLMDEKEVHYISGEAYLDFELDGSVILPRYKRNPEELAKIEQSFAEIRNNPGAEIIGLTIIGYASPDGGYDNNESLAYRRVFSIVDYVQSRFDIRPEYSNVGAVAEDWEKFREMVAESNTAYKSRILEIIDGPGSFDAKEAKLRRLGGGAAWNLLKEKVFPKLRRVEYRIDYRIAGEQPAE